MAVTQVEPVVIVRGEDNQVLQRMELLVGSSSDLASAPECAPGSIAYTADLTFIAMFNGTEWVTIKGGE